MNEDVIADLKQFISTTVSQHTTGIRDEITGQLRKEMQEGFAAVDRRFTQVDKRFDDLSEAIADAIEAANEATAAQLRDHERRIVRLEKRTA